MTFRRLLFLGLTGMILLGGCSSSDSQAKQDRVCTPGANVFCRCADRTPGTKLCGDDGKAFVTTCSTNESRTECVGGEVEDPLSGHDVDEGGNLIGPDAGTVDAIETCPGKSTSLTPGVELAVEGDTTGATDDAQGRSGGACAAGAGGADHVYRLIPTGSGSLTVKVQGTGAYNPTVYLRTTCSDEATQVACGETTGAGGAEQVHANVATGKSYYLFVDGASSSAGTYKITAKLTTGSFCGDGKVDTNEACDDGNNTDGDGCSNDCQKVNGDPMTASSCPGHAVSVWPGRTVNGSGTNLTYGNAWNAPSRACDPAGTNNEQDHVYEVTPRATGILKVVLTPEAGTNLMLSARSTCTDPATTSESMCANDGSTGGTEALAVPVTKNERVYVAVDGGGLTSNKGKYTISFQIQ